MRETLGESKSNRLFSRNHDDRDLRRCLSHRLGDSVGVHHKHIDVEGGEFGGERRQPLRAALSVSLLDHNILSLDVAQLPQALRECLKAPRVGRRRTRHQQPDLGDLPRRLCHSEKRRYEHAEDERDETPDSAVPHSRLLASVSC